MLGKLCDIDGEVVCDIDWCGWVYCVGVEDVDVVYWCVCGCF